MREFVDSWKTEFTARIKTATKSRKFKFTLYDAIERSEGLCTPFDTIMCECVKYFKTNPLRENDYYKYLTAWKAGVKLDEKYFKHDISLLHEYYKKIDTDDTYTPFTKEHWERYVLFMMLKIEGVYDSETMDEVFNVSLKDGREYNPATGLCKLLRWTLPDSLRLKEYDIKRAYPTFIDLMLGVEREEDIYSIIDKKKFNTLINIHAGIKGADIEKVRRQLKPVYNGRTDEVITEDRFNTQGQMFRDLTQYEHEYILKFVEENKIENYVRLHDAVIISKKTKIEKTEFGKVKFALENIDPPPIINNIKLFYEINQFGEVDTDPVMYRDFFEQEKFIRVTMQGNDKITIFKDSNNVVKPLNHRTDIAPFLSDNINEIDKSPVENKIARDNYKAIQEAYLLLNPKPLVYYTDTQDTFGIPFKNGFFKYTKGNAKLDVLDYTDVTGFFAPHVTQEHEFKPLGNDNLSEMERFVAMIAIGQDVKDGCYLSDEELQRLEGFHTMIGYLCHTYKDPAFSPAVILSDNGADDISRNGGRGKTMLTKALSYVQPVKIKGGDEFDSGYRHRFADLDPEHKIYVLDDVKAGFQYDDLYTNIVNGISCERKGSKAEIIPFEQSPKFLITTNWAVRYDAAATSTIRRFVEYKLTDFFNLNNTIIDVFGHRFFDEWDDEEWNNFYNFIFHCVSMYMEKGLIVPQYDKTGDNYRAYFSNDVMVEEFERIFTWVSRTSSFSVMDFLTEYKHKENPLRFENYFHHNNLKTMIDVYLKYHNLNYEYSKRTKKWTRV